MNFHSVKFAYFDTCYSGRLIINSYGQLVEGRPGEIGQAFDGPHSDMSWALRMHNPLKSQAYLGWWGKAISDPPPWETAYQKWTRNEWGKLGDGDDLLMAINCAISQQTEAGPKDPINNFRLKGHGLIQDIKLEN
jgi:hypothetical protein